MNNRFCPSHTIYEVIFLVDKKEKKDQEKFNSITQKKKTENQNQQHNVRREAVDAARRQI